LIKPSLVSFLTATLRLKPGARGRELMAEVGEVDL
jgi:hypothetical protein